MVRTKLKLRSPERTLQLFPFFYALCLRFQVLLENLESGAIAVLPDSVSKTGIAKIKRVLIVDDSKTYQTLIDRICQSHPDLEVVGMADNPAEAEPLIYKLYPDVITLDVQMPGMDGFTFLAHLLKKYPIPVVLISSVNSKQGNEVFNALYQGAIDFIPKSLIQLSPSVMESLSERIYLASRCSLESLMRFYTGAPGALETGKLDTGKVVAIGVGVGGTRTLVDILRQLPKDIPPVVIGQRILPQYSAVFLSEMEEACSFKVKLAEEGEKLEAGKVLLPPEGKAITVVRVGEELLVSFQSAESEAQLTLLFHSVASAAGSKAIGVLLTGSGVDGAQGLLEIRHAGGTTIIQDESDAADPSVSREAIRIGAAETACVGDRVGEVLLAAMNEGLSDSEYKSLLSHTLYEGEGREKDLRF